MRSGADDSAQARTVLQSLRAGYLDIVELFAPALREYMDPWKHIATDAERSRQLCVDGDVSEGTISFGFGLTTSDADELVSLEPLSSPNQHPRRAPSGGSTLRHVNLKLARLRVDSGRLFGTRTALRQIIDIVAGKQDGPLSGWLARERMAELVNCLDRNGLLGEDISSWTRRELADWMERPERKACAGWIVDRQIIQPNELRGILSSLERDVAGDLRLTELAIARPQVPAEVVPALRKLFEAVTATYKAVCEEWFPEVCKHFTYGLGPFRFVATVEPAWVTYWLEPTAHWGTPCDVKTMAPNEQRQPLDVLLRNLECRAAELGREPFGSMSSSSRLLTDWRSPVSREVRSMLTKDLKSVEAWMLSAT